MSTTEIAVKSEIFSFAPKNFAEAMQYAELMAASDFVPKDYKGKPGNILVAIQMGQELDLKPMQALQNIAVINGRPCVWGDAQLAIVMNHKDFISINESLNQGVATCKISRRNFDPVIRTFSIDEAKKAGLWGKQGPWTHYADRMLQMRARGFALRDSFADALKGLISREEAQDYPYEKNITPNRFVEATTEKGSRLKEKLGLNATVNETVDLNTGEIFDNSQLIAAITLDITKASSFDDLEKVRATISTSSLTDLEKNPLREAYIVKSKALKLKEAQEPSTEQSAESKEFFGDDKE